AADLLATPVLRFRARGDGGVFLFELITLESGQGVFAKGFRAPKDAWATVEVRLDRLRSLFMDPRSRGDLTHALTIRFVTPAERRGPFRLGLDDLVFPSRGG